MLRTQITIADAANGQKMAVPDEFRAGVERANQLLETELFAVKQLDIDASWRFVQQSGNRVSVLLDLTTNCEGNPVGITGYPMDADAFTDETKIKASLNRLIWIFSSIQAHINKVEIKHSLDRIQSALLAG